MRLSVDVLLRHQQFLCTLGDASDLHSRLSPGLHSTALPPRLRLALLPLLPRLLLRPWLLQQRPLLCAVAAAVAGQADLPAVCCAAGCQGAPRVCCVLQQGRLHAVAAANRRKRLIR